jgi:hypothetical protein
LILAVQIGPTHYRHRMASNCELTSETTEVGVPSSSPQGYASPGSGIPILVQRQVPVVSRVCPNTDFEEVVEVDARIQEHRLAHQRFVAVGE